MKGKKITGVILSVLFGLLSIPAVSAADPSDHWRYEPSYVYRGYVSTVPSPVRLAGEEVFTINADAGGFTARERSIIIEKNLNNALIAASDRSPAAVEIVTINRLPVIRIDGKHVLTIDSSLAYLNGRSCEDLAREWAGNMKRAMSDQNRVNDYVAQLSGDYLYSPYSPPYREAQWRQARMNHAAFQARPDLPLDLVSSASIRDEGFKDMLDCDPVAAEAKFREAIKLDFENQRAHYGLGTALLKQGKVDEAVKELELARWQDHDDAQVHLALGQAMESKGHDTEAIVRYREASLLQPANPEGVLLIADLREIRDDISKSAVELSDAMKVNPNSEYIRLRRKDQIGWRLIRPY